MRVLFADKLADQARTSLTAAGFDVRTDSSLAGELLTATLAEHDPDILVVRSTRVDADQIAAAKSLSLVIRAGAGVNTIDLDACGEHGVFVANCPGQNAVAVAELTLGLLLAIDRHIPQAAADLRAGLWDKKRFAQADGLKGRSFGVLGMGDIGRETARRAQAFGMEVLAWSRSLTEAQATRLGVRRC